MLHEALAEHLQGLPHAGTQLLADTAPGLDPLLVPALQAAARCIAGIRREARPMQQPPEHGELGVEATGDDAFEIDLEESRPGDLGGIAQQAEPTSIRDEAPKRAFSVQIFLDQGMRRPAVGPAIIQLAVERYDVDRHCTFGLTGEM